MTARLRSLLTGPAGGGVVLSATAVLALAVANSPWGAGYGATLDAKVGGLSVLHWINDGLMAVFFLLIGLEIKREVLTGDLSTADRRSLPGLAAIGGMIVPALIYIAFNLLPGGELRGWAIPAATDIAFALGILALLGPRIPPSLKIFLTALAIIDDLGAILIIAMFYSGSLSWLALGGAAIVVGGLVALNRAGRSEIWPYLALGLVLWVLVLLSGVHATLAGVTLAMTIPMRMPEDSSPLHRLEHGLHVPVTFMVLPIFGFANAGVVLLGLGLADLVKPVSLGIAAGLFVGKQAGVMACAWLGFRLGWIVLPEGVSWRQLYGVACLCGVGFTMSLFIGILAFPDDAVRQEAVKLGVILGSTLSALVGALVLLSGRPKPAST